MIKRVATCIGAHARCQPIAAIDSQNPIDPNVVVSSAARTGLTVSGINNTSGNAIHFR